jgi:hypothetical protein
MHGHLPLQDGESLLWSAWTQQGDEDTRPTAGHLFVTDRRVAFRPSAIERVAGERGWECALQNAKLLIRPGDYITEVPILRSIALRGRITVSCTGREPMNFWFLHSEQWLLEQLRDLPIHMDAP